MADQTNVSDKLLNLSKDKNRKASYNSLKLRIEDNHAYDRKYDEDKIELPIEEFSEKHSTQPVVNQSGTLMAARNRHGHLMLMHETRIFYFYHDQNDIPDDCSYSEAVTNLTTLILNMLSTRKYRILWSMYFAWHILDYGMLGSLIITSTLFWDTADQRFEDVIWQYKWIFFVFGIEAFYRSLKSFVQIWILNRVSLYIGIVLLSLYAITFTFYGFWTDLVQVLFCVRLIAFACADMVNFSIDLELEYDLKERFIHKLDLPICMKTKTVERIGILYVGDYNEVHWSQIAPDWVFKGSISVSTCKNTFNCDVQKSGFRNMRYYRSIFHCMSIWTYIIFGGALVVIITAVVSVMSVFEKLGGCCLCRKGNDGTIWSELFTRYSY
eukprot:126210_1